MIPWKSCSESSCSVSLAAVRGAGQGGSLGVKIHGEGCGSFRVGWSFDRLVAFALEDALTMWLRVQASSPSDSPPLEGTWVALYRGSMQRSRKVLIHDCRADFADGQAHRVVIPISDLYRPGDGFDPQIAEGIAFEVFSSASRNFDIYVDDIRLEAIDAAASRTSCQPAL
jgi:hypothetical protein